MSSSIAAFSKCKLRSGMPLSWQLVSITPNTSPRSMAPPTSMRQSISSIMSNLISLRPGYCTCRRQRSDVLLSSFDTLDLPSRPPTKRRAALGGAMRSCKWFDSVRNGTPLSAISSSIWYTTSKFSTTESALSTMKYVLRFATMSCRNVMTSSGGVSRRVVASQNRPHDWTCVRYNGPASRMSGGTSTTRSAACTCVMNASHGAREPRPM
mmetsp:Transcript_10852/g.26224  ORF Transcript_10852/g.26224 Transcript_10852/m.26224 type:complete len:210 (+) Transcript_10852:619-1248(+)